MKMLISALLTLISVSAFGSETYFHQLPTGTTFRAVENIELPAHQRFVPIGEIKKDHSLYARCGFFVRSPKPYDQTIEAGSMFTVKSGSKWGNSQLEDEDIILSVNWYSSKVEFKNYAEETGIICSGFNSSIGRNFTNSKQMISEKFEIEIPEGLIFPAHN